MAITPPLDDAPALPLPDRAWHLFCQGLSYSAIGRILGMDRETVARHVRAIHHDLQTDRRADRGLALSRALATAHAVQAAAWQALAHEEALEEASFSIPAGSQSDSPSSVAPQPTYRAHRARLLSIILAAAREAARLELLYDKDTPARAADKDAQPHQSKIVIMMRPSDQDELRRMGYDISPSPTAPTAPTAPSSTAPDAPAADIRARDAGAPVPSAPIPATCTPSADPDPDHPDDDDEDDPDGPNDPDDAPGNGGAPTASPSTSGGGGPSGSPASSPAAPSSTASCAPASSSIPSAPLGRGKPWSGQRFLRKTAACPLASLW